MDKGKFTFLYVIIVLAAFCAGGFVTRWADRAAWNTKGKVNFSTFWDVWEIIEKESVQKDSLDRSKMVEGAIKGLVGSLGDPHSRFLNAEENQEEEEDSSGKFDGIGAELEMKEKILTVITPMKNSPAERAGLRAVDKIIFIDKKLTSEMTMREAGAAIKEKKGTRVILTIKRDGTDKLIDIPIVRDTIIIPLYTYKIKNGNIAYLQLHQFPLDIKEGMFSVANDMAKKGITKMVFDLRNNPGGYLIASIHVASFFFPEKTLIATSQSGNGETEVFTSLRVEGDNLQNVTVVVLVNNGSASASEIVAGALKDHKRALIVGQQTYGKGSVQSGYALGDNTMLRLTTAKWLTPSGDWISKKGITPDVIVEMTEKDIKSKRDPQLEKALEILRGAKQ